MKTTLMLAVLTVTLISAAAQNYQVRENGLNHRVWEASVEKRDAGNRVVTRSVNYTELASGLMYEDNGELKPSKAEIELFQNGAAARKGQHKVIFAPDASAEVTIDLEARDGKRFQSRVIGLAFYDRVSGQSALFAEIKPSVGELLPPNQVLYANAFTDIDADLLYTYTISGFEQFVILNERPPPPEEYGLNSATTQLEVWTEFLEPPVPAKRAKVLANGLGDEALDFGEMKIGRGTAFYNGGGGSVVVGKAWQKISGRDFLIEAVLHNEVKPQLDLLPQRQAANRKTPEVLRAAVRKERTVPTRRLAGVNAGKIEVANVVRPRQGFIIDYTTLSGSLTDYTFRGDTTYLISGWVSVDGTATIEGGAVLKYTNNAGATVGFQGEVIFQTSEYSPAVLTCKDDNSIGQTIAGSTGTPSGYYASRALEFITATQPIQYVRVSHATTAVALLEYNLPIRHCQFTFCKTGIDNDFATSTLEDVLMHRVETPFMGTNLTVRAQHLTVHECNKLTDRGNANSTIYLTNSLLIHMTNWGTSLYVTNSVAVVNDSAVFQTLGAGKHYLANASPYRDAGTTNISAALAGELRKRTTYPPVMAGHLIILGNTNLILSTQAGRDTDIPDLGYHYSPIDFTFGGVYVTNSTITLNPGTVIALYSPTNGGGSYYGIALSDGAKFFSEGSATNLNRIVRYNTVQEQSGTSWNTTPALHIASDWGDVAHTPEARFRFTGWSIPAADTVHFYGYYGTDLAAAFTDCQFWGGMFKTERPTVNVTNSLFHRTALMLEGVDNSLDARFQNTLFYGGSLYLYQEFGGTFTFKDNLFDRVAITQAVTPTHDYNGYVTNAPLQSLTNSGTHNVFTSAFSYQTGALGRFYQPTNSPFLGLGSTNANLLGLYHYTTTTNQPPIPEGNSRVDIGLHYVAANVSGIPIDSDEDGNPDYVEDQNGNGMLEPQEVSGLRLWVRAEASEVSTNGSGLVATWSDQSGTANNATQSTDAKKPKWEGNIVNGKGAVKFDGSDDTLKTTRISATNDFTILAVALPAVSHQVDVESASGNGGSSGQKYLLLQNEAAGTPNSGVGVSLGTNGISAYEYENVNGNQSDPNPPLAVHTSAFGSNFVIATVTHAAKTPAIYVNGVFARGGLASSATGEARAPDRIGGNSSSSFFNGHVAETLIYTGVLSSVKRMGVERYLNGKFNIWTNAPGTPTSLSAFAVSTNQINLAWTGSAYDASYRIERKAGSGGTFELLTNVGATVTGFLDRGLAANTLYYYRVRAENLVGESAYSAEVSATTSSSAAGIPLSALKLWLKADADVFKDSSNYVNKWVDQSGTTNNATQYEGDYQPIFTNAPINSRPAIRFDGYDDVLGAARKVATNEFAMFVVARTSIGHDVDPENNNSAGETGQNFVVDPRLGGSSEVVAGAGISIGTNGVSAYEDHNALSGLDHHEPAVAVASNLVVGTSACMVEVAYSNRYARLYWNGGLVRAGPIASTRPAVVSPTSLGYGRHASFPNAFSGHLAEALIFNRALSVDETYAVGNYLRQKYGVSGTAPATPTNFLATGLSDTQIQLSWMRAGISETGFKVERKPAGGAYAQIAHLDSGTTNLTDSVASATNQYYYRLKAYNYYGESAYSSEIAPPTANLTSPTNFAIFISGSTNTLSAESVDPDGSVGNVQFLIFTTILATDSTSPYSTTWSTNLASTYTLYAKATDNQGNTRISKAITVNTSKDSDGDGLSDLAEYVLGTDPADTDTDNDGVNDALDQFPTDPSRSSGDAGDTTPPTIFLQEPLLP